MADDIVLNLGSGGATVSTEQLTSGGDSSHAQRIKVITGAAHVDGGDVTTSNGLPVQVCDSAGHTMPSGDALARAIAVKPTDGTTAITVKAGSTAAVAADTAEVVSLSPNSPIPYPSRTVYSAIAAASLVVKASPGSLYSIRIRNRSASVVYAMVFNSTTVPADGTVTPFLPPFLIPAGSDVSFGTDYFTDSGLALSTGISIAVSTTDSTTKTLAGTAANHDISGAFT